MRKIIVALLLIAILLAGCTQRSNSNGNTIDVSKQIVEVGDTIKVEYEGRLEDGNVFDSSANHGTPLEFVAGTGKMIQGFDEAVIGMRLNEEKTVTIPPQKAYGSVKPEKIIEIPKRQFTNWDDLVIGMVVHNNETGTNGRITELKEDSAIVDFNHELAGQTLTFWIEVVEIEKAK